MAVRAHQLVDVGPYRVISLRFFNGHVHRLGLLALTESAVVILSVYAAVVLALSGGDFASLWPQGLLITTATVLSLAALGLYQLRQRARFSGVLARLLVAVLLAQAMLGAVLHLAPALFFGHGVIALFGPFAFAGLALTRYAFQQLVDEDLFKRRVLVWGAGRRAALITKRLRRRCDQRGFKIVGYIRAPGDGADVPKREVLRFDGDLVRLALRQKVEEIVIAMDERRGGFPSADLLECRLRGIQVCEVLAFLEKESGRVNIELMHPSWLIFSEGFRCDVVRLITKRFFDIAVSLAVLVIASPIALLTALAILLEDRGPILYRQTRTGQDGRRFALLKFRSMPVNAEADGRAVWAAQNDARITRTGALIRKLRIDELPQVLNVLLGQMSFVGPRPERPEFVARFTASIPYYAERHFVKPGITGWAQVRYSYGASEKDAQAKLEYDLYYVKHHSLIFDLMVLVQTVEIVLFRIGSR